MNLSSCISCVALRWPWAVNRMLKSNNWLTDMLWARSWIPVQKVCRVTDCIRLYFNLDNLRDSVLAFCSFCCYTCFIHFSHMYTYYVSYSHYVSYTLIVLTHFTFSFYSLFSVFFLCKISSCSLPLWFLVKSSVHVLGLRKGWWCRWWIVGTDDELMFGMVVGRVQVWTY